MPSLPYSLEALLLGRSRGITPEEGDAIIPDVVISETHDDDVTVTQHPVDTGAPISDHAFVQPAIVTCVFGWSDSSRLINSALDGSIGSVRISVSGEVIPGAAQRGCPLYLRCSMPDLMR